jgi:hypothetical protein
VPNRKPFSGWKRATACIRPTLPAEIASEIGGLERQYSLAILGSLTGSAGRGDWGNPRGAQRV